MKHVLLTAFEPYDVWQANASWLALVELTRQLPPEPKITTRLYPVDFDAMRSRLHQDLESGYDFVVLTGQAPGRSRVELETVALNLAAHSADEGFFHLVEDGPLAYATGLPTQRLCQRIREVGVPAAVSCHAGTYLCNASLYLALHEIETRKLETQAIFVHLPLDTQQAVAHPTELPSMPADTSARALLAMLTGMIELDPTPPTNLA